MATAALSEPVAASVSHPLDNITPREHQLAISLIRAQHSDFEPWFKVVQRQEPPKAQLVPWLDAFHAGKNPKPLPRMVEALYIEPKTGVIHEALVDIGAKSIRSHSIVEGAHRTNLDISQLEALEEAIVKDPQVKQALVELGLDENIPIASDPWIYGADSFDDQPALMQFLMYLKPPRVANDPDCFHYSWPLPFVPVVDVLSGQLVRVDWVYTGDSADGMKYTWKEEWKMANMEEREYMPHLQSNFKERDGLKPLLVEQPEGPSFVVDGQRVQWQGWDMRISWTSREGLVIHDVRFKGRSTFHRLSLSEMTVPYGDRALLCTESRLSTSVMHPVALPPTASVSAATVSVPFATLMACLPCPTVKCCSRRTWYACTSRTMVSA